MALNEVFSFASCCSSTARSGHSQRTKLAGGTHGHAYRGRRPEALQLQRVIIGAAPLFKPVAVLAEAELVATTGSQGAAIEAPLALTQLWTP